MQQGICWWNWQEVNFFQKYLMDVYKVVAKPVSLYFNSPNHLGEADIFVTTLQFYFSDQNIIQILEIHIIYNLGIFKLTGIII